MMLVSTARCLASSLGLLPAAQALQQLQFASAAAESAAAATHETSASSAGWLVDPTYAGVQVDPRLQPSTSGTWQPWEQPGPTDVLPRLIPRVARRPLPLLQALQQVKDTCRTTRFDATVEAHIRLKVDPRRGDQMVRGSAVLPYSIGKPVRICVFAEGAAAEEARAAGADIVGDVSLVASILESKGKQLDFDRCLAHPDMMKSLVVLGKILGPKKLMPNPKVGTLTTDLAGAIAAERRGRLEFKMDRTAIVHAPVGKVSMSLDMLHANIGALLRALMAVKPEAVKGGMVKYVRKVDVCSTHGGGFEVELASLAGAMDAAANIMQPQGS